MRSIWLTSFLLATACGSADSGDPEPTTSELAGEQGVDAPKDSDPIPAPADPPSCFAAPCNPTPPPKLHDCDVRKITCQTFAPVVCPDGTVATVVDSCYGECVPKDQCAPSDP